MIDLLPFVLILAIALLAMFGIARWQARQYQSYLNRHVDETRKLTESQSRTQDAVERQTAALERIAAALETRDRG
jgi:hypothetical protein